MLLAFKGDLRKPVQLHVKERKKFMFTEKTSDHK